MKIPEFNNQIYPSTSPQILSAHKMLAAATEGYDAAQVSATCSHRADKIQTLAEDMRKLSRHSTLPTSVEADLALVSTQLLLCVTVCMNPPWRFEKNGKCFYDFTAGFKMYPRPFGIYLDLCLVIGLLQKP
jgi:hypothetical protein